MSDSDGNHTPVAERPALPASYGILPPEKGIGLIPWEQVCARIEVARNYWVATTRPNGWPHVMPVWGLWRDGAFYLDTDSASRKARNIAAQPNIVVHLESGDDAVILEGRVTEARDAETLAWFAVAYTAKYQWKYTPGGEDRVVFVMRPRVAYAWSESDYVGSATRYTFENA